MLFTTHFSQYRPFHLTLPQGLRTQNSLTLSDEIYEKDKQTHHISMNEHTHTHPHT